MARQKKKNQRRSAKRSETTKVDFREVGKLFAVAFVVIVAVWAGKQVDDIPIKTIEIQSTLEKVDKDEIKTIVQNHIQDGFFTINLSEFERQINDIPWVYRASIKRKWPGRVVINIAEQQPYFRWGSNHLINKYGDKFYAEDANKYTQIPLLEGVDGRERELIDLYYKYSDGFKQVNSQIVSLKEDARYDKEIRLINGITINLGRDQSDVQIRRCLHSFAMFTKAEREAIASIDMRHGNGFAVRWNG